MSELRVGIIGAGAIAPVHAKVIARIEGARVAYVESRTRARAEAFALEHGAEVVDDVPTLVDRSDAVLICAPGYVHAEYTLAALRAGKPVLCEKPGAISVEQAEQVVGAVERGGVYQLGLNRRHAPIYRRVAGLLREGFGPTSYAARINRGELSRPSWVGDPSISGGYGFETVIHMIDLLRHLFGEVRDVEARLSRNVYQEPDDLTLLFEHANGVHGALTSCAHATWMPPFERVEVFGREGTLRTEELDRLCYRTGLGNETQRVDFEDLSEDVRWGFDAQLRIFIARARGEATLGLEAGAHDLLVATRLIERIYEGES